MKVNPRALFLGSAIVAAASYAVCALAVAVDPEATSRFFSFVFHIDLMSLVRHVTWPGFFGGIVFFSLGAGIHAALAAAVYNRLLGRA